MKAFVGLGVVFGCVAIGYGMSGGHFHVLWQPAEFLIIWGASIGSFILGNPSSVVSHVGGAFGDVFSGKKISQQDYIDLLCLQFSIFKTARAKGLLTLESHIEQPLESEIFQKFPNVMKNKSVITFLCDYLRLFTMGSDNVYQMEDLMIQELDIYAHELHEMSSAVTNAADGMPALGIVAAVLGVIHTMGSINEPPEVLGHLIGAALVGTFAGVLFSYGFLGPIANSMKSIELAKVQYLQCVKTGLIAYLHGHPPMIAIDYARKNIEEHVRPSFSVMEEAIQNIGDVVV